MDNETLLLAIDGKFTKLYEKLEENMKCIRQTCSARKEECAARFVEIEGQIKIKEAVDVVLTGIDKEKKDWGIWIIRGALSTLAGVAVIVVGMILSGKIQIWVK